MWIDDIIQQKVQVLIHENLQKMYDSSYDELYWMWANTFIYMFSGCPSDSRKSIPMGSFFGKIPATFAVMYLKCVFDLQTSGDDFFIDTHTHTHTTMTQFTKKRIAPMRETPPGRVEHMLLWHRQLPGPSSSESLSLWFPIYVAHSSRHMQFRWRTAPDR